LEQLLKDAAKIARNPGYDFVTDPARGHSLGRIVYFILDGELLVVDGQQRLTTLLLLLSTLVKLLPADSALTGRLKNILFGGREKGSPILVPTYHDRAPFKAALQGGDHPVNSQVTVVSNSLERLVPGCLSTISSKLSCSATDAIVSLVDVVLHGFRLLKFPLPSDGSDNGGDNLLTIYERLARREVSMMGMLSNAAPGVAMHVLDLSRNLMLRYAAHNAGRAITPSS
jgi:hypothetical protein